MKKSTMLLDFLFASTRAFVVKTVTVKAQTKIDEKRNVKQPPELFSAKKVSKKFIPSLSKLYQKAFLCRQFSRNHHLYIYVPI